MANLYPLKFHPIYKERIWGGNRFQSVFKRKDIPDKISSHCGESWELSAVEENLSVVSNGFLEGNNIQELVEVYMDELVGTKVYDRFGLEFPLLFKYLDTTDRLSIQVHPDDNKAKERHHAWGKSELWYIVNKKPKSQLIVGFNRDVTSGEYIKCLEEKNFPEILNFETPEVDDVYYIPAGRLHAILEGFLIAEIQQTSDVTYRIYDWDRVDKNGRSRELHTELAVDVLEYNCPEGQKYVTEYDKNKALVEVKETPFFTVNRLILDNDSIVRNIGKLDSFIVLMCLEGHFTVEGEGFDSVLCKKGETVLLPASIDNCILTTGSNAKVIEVFVK
jgi:mannose-6-phosphate isomerase